MTLNHKELVDLLQRAYSAEKAAAFAYQGHAGSVKDKVQKAAIRQIEIDEWNHRKEVLEIMNQCNIPVSKWYEFRFHVIGKTISFGCYIIGWFMPFYFAGSLESGNVCEYFRMKQFFNELGIKEHEVYFLSMIKNNRLLPFFEKVFRWGNKKSANNIDMEALEPVEESDIYCKRK